MKRQNEKTSLPSENYEMDALKRAAERNPSLNVDLLNLGVNFVLMSNSVYDVIEKFFINELKISQAKFVVLMYLSGAKSGLTQAEIARRWSVSDSAICRVIKGLEKEKFIKRKKSTVINADQREKIITITLKGQRIFDRALVEYPQWLLRTIGDLDKDEPKKLALYSLEIKRLFLIKG